MAAYARSNVTHLKSGNPLKPKITYTPTLYSPKEARFQAEEYVYPEQRPLRPHHVQYLRHLLESGHFRPGTEIHFARVAQAGGQRYQVNGRHTLTALAQQPQSHWLTVVEYSVTSYEEVGRLYATFDRPMLRSWKDVYRASKELAECELSPKQMERVGAAMLLLAGGFRARRDFNNTVANMLRDAEVRLTMIVDWHDEAASCMNGLRVGRGKAVERLQRAAVLSVVLVTYRYQPDKAHEFWPSVVRDSGLLDGQPAKALVRWLTETPAKMHQPTVYARFVASCWNRFFLGQQQHNVTARPGNKPIIIAGTPHTGNSHYAYLTPVGESVHDPVLLSDAQDDGDEEDAP